METTPGNRTESTSGSSLEGALNNGRIDSNPFVTFVVGGVIGAVTALLLAPASGVEMRRRLRNSGAGTATRARRAFMSARRAAAARARRIAYALEHPSSHDGRNGHRSRAVSARTVRSARRHRSRPKSRGRRSVQVAASTT